MSKGDTTENDVMKVMFRNTANTPSYLGAANLYIALHNTDPADSGNQSTGEANYTSYDRVAVTKDASGWGISGNYTQNVGLIQFPQCGASGQVVGYVSIGLVAGVGNSGQILYAGSLNSPLTISNLIQPQFASGALQITED
jgi:hypothetical protein